MCGQDPSRDRTEEDIWILLLANLARARQILQNFNPEIKLPRGSTHSLDTVKKSIKKFEDEISRRDQGRPKAMGRPSLDLSGYHTEEALKESLENDRFKNFVACVRCSTQVYALETTIRQSIGTPIPIDLADDILDPPPLQTQGLSEFVLVPRKTLKKLRRMYIKGTLTPITVESTLRRVRNTLKLKTPRRLRIKGLKRTTETPKLTYLDKFE